MHDGTFIDSLMLCRNFWEHLVVQVCIKSDMSCFKSFLDILSGFSYLIYVHVKLFVIYMRKISLSTLMLISNRRSEVHSFPDSFKCVWWWNLCFFFPHHHRDPHLYCVIVMFSSIYTNVSGQWYPAGCCPFQRNVYMMMNFMIFLSYQDIMNYTRTILSTHYGYKMTCFLLCVCVCRRACDILSFINTEPKAATGKDDEINEKKRGTLLMMAHFFFLFIMFPQYDLFSVFVIIGY